MRIKPSLLRTRLAIEFLEDRTVPTTATLSANGALTVFGSGGNDAIQITESAGQIAVSGQGQTFAAASVNTISIDAGEGSDTITLAPNVTATAYIFTGHGNSYVQGGGGTNHIFGGGGNDTLIGGSGSDTIYGGTGTSQISAPAGATISQGSPFVTASLTAEAQQILDLTNQFRAQNGLAPLTYNAQLTAAANLQANNMVGMVPFVGYSDAMNHTLNGAAQPTLTSRLETVGYSYKSGGENIAYGFADANSVFTAWINSPGHRANILSPTNTEIGIAIATTSDGVPYYAQVFGAPAANNPSGPSPVTTVPGPTTPPVTTPPPILTSPPVTPTDGFGAGSGQTNNIYAVGTDSGVAGMVTVYNAATGAVKFNFAPYGNQFAGGVRVATGDMNGDGNADLVVAPGPGMSPLIKIYDGVTGNLIRSFNAYNSAFTGGVNIALGDVNRDGHLDIITGADAGGGPHVKVFDGQNLNVLQSFFAYNSGFTGGVRVASGDINGDGYADIITGAGAGGGPHVEVFDGATGNLSRSFFAFSPNFSGGVYVSAGDLNNDGKADLIVSAGATGGPHVRAFDGVNGGQLASFFAADPNFSGGVRTRTLTVNGQTDIMTSTGAGNRDISVFSATGQMLDSFLAGDPSDMTGVFVG